MVTAWVSETMAQHVPCRLLPMSRFWWTSVDAVPAVSCTVGRTCLKRNAGARCRPELR
jgi:hypothetical protein